MKEKISYVAFDGVEFDTKEKCEQYEFKKSEQGKMRELNDMKRLRNDIISEINHLKSPKSTWIDSYDEYYHCQYFDGVVTDEKRMVLLIKNRYSLSDIDFLCRKLKQKYIDAINTNGKCASLEYVSKVCYFSSLYKLILEKKNFLIERLKNCQEALTKINSKIKAFIIENNIVSD